MGVGYLFGCLISVVTWRIDRHILFEKFHKLLLKKLKKELYFHLFYLGILILIIFLISIINQREAINFLVAMITIEFNNGERKATLNKVGDKRYFYDTLAIISRTLVCGFIAPITYIILFGNLGAIIYTGIYYINLQSNLKVFRLLNNLLNIIPSIISVGILYLIYVPRNRTLTISFKGDFLRNIFHNPLINVCIMAAYIESINFYYYVERKNVHFLKSYGAYINKIDDVSIKDFLSLIYSICFIVFIAFWMYEAQFLSLIIVKMK